MVILLLIYPSFWNTIMASTINANSAAMKLNGLAWSNLSLYVVLVFRKKPYPRAIGQQRNNAHAIRPAVSHRLPLNASRIRTQSSNDSTNIDRRSV